MKYSTLSTSILSVLLPLVGCLHGSMDPNDGSTAHGKKPTTQPEAVAKVSSLELDESALQSRGSLGLRVSLGLHPPAGVRVTIKVLKNKTEVASLPLAKEEDRYATTWSDPDPGAYTLIVLVDDKALYTENLVVASVPAFGGGRAKSARFALPPHVEFFGNTEALFELSDWIAHDDNSAYLVEWFKDGQRVQMGEDARRRYRAYGAEMTAFMPSETDWRVKQKAGEEKLLPAWEWHSIRVVAPKSFTEGAGHWEILVHRENRPSQRFVVDVASEMDPKRGQRWKAATNKRECKERDSFNRVTCEAALLEPTEVATSDAIRAALAAVPHEKRSINETGIAVTAEQARAVARSMDVWKLRTEIDYVQRSGNRAAQNKQVLEQGENESPMAFYKRKQAAKREYEAGIAGADNSGTAKAAQLWLKLKPLVAKYGGPWTPSEHPYAKP